LECIYCKEKNVIKHSKQNGIQRFRCNDCKKTFSSSSIIPSERKELIRKSLHLLLDGYKTKEIADYLNLSYDTINNWKNKYLRKLKELLPDKTEHSLKEDIGSVTISFKQTKKLSLFRNRKEKR